MLLHPWLVWIASPDVGVDGAETQPFGSESDLSMRTKADPGLAAQRSGVDHDFVWAGEIEFGGVLSQENDGKSRHALHGRMPMSAQDLVIIDFVVGEESVSGFAFGFLAIASGWDTETGLTGEASKDKAGTSIETEVIEVESGQFLIDPRVHNSASELRKIASGEDRERGFPSSAAPQHCNRSQCVKDRTASDNLAGASSRRDV
jgi:hypothetical protein